MAKLIIIAGIGKNRELGKDNTLIWHLKEDLKFFKDNTMGHKIVMGYNTYTSLPKKLPGREPIVLTHKKIQIDGVRTFNEIETLKKYLKRLKKDVYIIGGSSIYQLFLQDADELLLTEIDAECKDADVYFPKFKKKDYKKKIIKKANENNINYKYVSYRRVK